MSLWHLENQIYNELLKRNGAAAEAFKGALYTFRDENNPDRFSQAANSLRHVVSLIIRDFELQDKENDFIELEKEFLSRLEEKGLSDSIAIKLSRKGIMKKKVEKLFMEDAEALPNPAKKRALFILRKLDNLHDKITAISHYGLIISEEDFSLLINEFVEIMIYFLTPAPKVMEEIDNLLKIENPTQNDIDKLKHLLNNPSHVQYFFINLKNPNWFELLRKNDYFLEPSRKEFFFNLNISIWPQGFYLIEMAKKIPDRISELIKGFENYKNFRIFRQLLECVYNLDSNYIIDLIPIMDKWIQVFLTISELVIFKKIINKLIASDEIEAALNIFNKILSFNEPKIRVQNERTQDKFYFLFSDYEDIFKNLIKCDVIKNTCRFIKFLCDKLAEDREFELKTNDQIKRDRSDIWRQSIDSNENAWESRDIKNLLVNTIRDTLLKLHDDNLSLFIKCLQKLSDYDWPIFKRIQIYFLNLYPDALKNELRGFLIDINIFEDGRYWHELFHLLKNHFDKLNEGDKQIYLNWIEKGIDLKKYEEYFKQFESAEERKKRKERICNKWMLKHLEPIKNNLPPHLKLKYKELIKLIGEIDEPDYNIKYSGPSFISSSPLSEEEIKDMEKKDLINYLIDWNNKKDEDLLPYSESSFGSKLSKVISENPNEYNEILSKFKSYPLNFLPYIIEGFIIALKNNIQFEQNEVFLKIKNFFYYLIDFYKKDNISNEIIIEIHKKIIEFLFFCMDEHYEQFSIERKKEIKDITKNYLDFKKIKIDYNKSDEIIIHRIAFYMDTLRWKIISLLLQYNYFILRNEYNEEKLLIKFVKEHLENLLIECLEKDEIIRAWFAYHIYYLYPLNNDWIIDALPKIFQEESKYRSQWRLAFESYLSCSHIHIEIYQKMREIYSKGVNKLQSEKFSENSKEMLVKHLILAYLEDLENLDDSSLINVLFKKENTRYFNHAMWYINKLYNDWKENDLINENQLKIEKIVKLWKVRIKQIEQDKDLLKKIERELQWFASFFEKSDKNTELLEILEIVLKSCKGRIDVYTRGVVLKLFEYLKDNYLIVLKCLNILKKGELYMWIYGDIESQLKEFIEYGLENYKDENIKNIMNKFIQELTIAGFHEFSKYYRE